MIGFLLFNLIFKAIPPLLQLHREYTDSWLKPIYLAFKNWQSGVHPLQACSLLSCQDLWRQLKTWNILAIPWPYSLPVMKIAPLCPFLRQADVFIDQLVAPIIAELKIVHLREILDLKKKAYLGREQSRFPVVDVLCPRLSRDIAWSNRHTA